MRFSLAMCVVLMATTAWADSIQLPVQGIVRTQAGAPVPDGTYAFAFKIYSSQTAKTPLWEGSQASVQLKDGVFTTVIGHNNLNPLKAAIFSENEEVWIGVKVASELDMPRRQIHGVPFAAYSHTAGALSCTDCITTEHLSDVVVQAKSITWIKDGSNSTVQDGLDMLNQKANGVQQTLNQHSTKLSDLGAQLDAANESLKSQNNVLTTTSEGLAAVEKTVTQHVAKLADLETDLSNVSLKAASNKQSVTALLATAKGHADLIASANIKIGQNTDNVSTLNDTLTTLSQAVTTNTNTSNANKESQTLLGQDLTKVQTTANTNKSDIGSLKIGLQGANASAQSANNKADENKQTLNQQTTDIKTLQDSVKTQGTSLVATQNLVNTNDETLKTVEKTANDAYDKATTLNKSVATVAGMANTNKTDVSDLKVQASQNQSSAKQANETAQSNANNITTLQNSLDSKTTSLNQQAQKNAADIVKLDDLIQKNATDVASALTKINNNSSSIIALDDNTSALALSISQLKEDVNKINTDLNFANKLIITVVDSQTAMDATPAATKVVYRSDEGRLWIYANGTWRRMMIEASCGDSVVDKGEECDDGNNDNNDGCIACKKATCGDGIVQTGVEDCDDANNNVNDDCVFCKNAICGDGYIESGNEVCDTNEFAGATCASITGENYTGSLECNSNCQAVGTALCKGPLGTISNPAPSCEAIELANTSNGSALYWLDMDGDGANKKFEGWCDFDTDDGPFTWARFDDGSLGGNQDTYRDFCAQYGMQIVVPRTKAHAKAISAQLNGTIPNLVNVFPKTSGAQGLSNWHGICKGDVPCENNSSNTGNRNFFVASHENNADCQNGDEQVPNGDNSTSYRLYRIGDGCEWGRWDDGNNSVSIQGWVVCSPNDS